MTPRLVRALLLGFLIGLVGLLISSFHISRSFEEDVGLGLLFELRGVTKPASDVVVVSIDKESSERLNISDNPDKWPRSLHAKLTEKLASLGAKVITFDVHFIEPRSAHDDAMFTNAVKKARNVVLAEPLKAKEVPVSEHGGAIAAEHSIVKIVKPFAPLAQAAVATAPFVLPRIPFKVNQYWTFQTGAGDSPTFPVVAFQLFTLDLYDDFIRLLERVSPSQASGLPRTAAAAMESGHVGRLIRDIRAIFETQPETAQQMLDELERSTSVVPDGTKSRWLKSLLELYGGANRRYINYYGPPRTITTIPYYRALQLGEAGNGDGQINFKDKAVFVGLSEKVLAERKDSFYTVFSQANGVFISGVEIAATAFANLLEDAPVRPVGSQAYVLLILVWGILVGIICRIAGALVAAVIVVGLSGLYLFGAAYQFKAAGIWYPIVIPLFVQSPVGYFSALLWNYFETNKERQNIRKALGYYVPNEVVDQLARNIVDIKGGGQTVYGACLFADVAGYTTLSEKMSPQQLSDLMHRYFEATFEPVRKNGGLVVNLKGDSFLAMWKAARADAALRKQACLAALGVAEAVRRFNDAFEDLKFPTRVGVHSGQIFLGNIGAGDHYEYGPTGDTVNTASRMDGLNKYLGTEVLVSEEVIHDLDGFLTREVGTFRLKGKAQPVVVHELLGRLEEADERKKEACAVFAQALDAFRRQSWDAASEKFHRAVENGRIDGPAQFYLERCEQYVNHPPEKNWDGVILLEEK